MARPLSSLPSSERLERLAAGTGLILFLFLIVHLLGNLLVFDGPAARNDHAEDLANRGALLWVGRALLGGALAVHLGAILVLLRRRRTDRSRALLVSGLVVLLFLVYHLLQTTIGVVIRPTLFERVDEQGRRDVYSMLVVGFQELPIALFYVLSMVGLGIHLAHGGTSMLSRAPRLAHYRRPFLTLVWLFVAVNVLIVLAAFVGWLALPPWEPLALDPG